MIFCPSVPWTTVNMIPIRLNDAMFRGHWVYGQPIDRPPMQLRHIRSSFPEKILHFWTESEFRLWILNISGVEYSSIFQSFSNGNSLLFKNIQSSFCFALLWNYIVNIIFPFFQHISFQYFDLQNHSPTGANISFLCAVDHFSVPLRQSALMFFFPCFSP